MIKKTKKMKRIVVFALALLLCASCFAFTAGAATTWVSYNAADIPAYNYWDMSKYSYTEKTNSGTQNAYIAYPTDIDANEGTLRFTHKYVREGTFYFPGEYIELTLKDICPDLVVGQTYCLNIENISVPYGKPSDCIELNSPLYSKSPVWRNGELRKINAIDLQAKVTIPIAYIAEGNGYPVPGVGDVTKSTLRIWITKDKPQDYMPHSVFENFYEQGYKSGEIAGYQKGSEEYVNDHLVVSAKNMTITPIYWDSKNGNRVVNGTFFPEDLEAIKFNGYSFNLKTFTDKFSYSCDGARLMGYSIMLIPEQYGRLFTVNESPFSLYANNAKVTLTVVTEDGRTLTYKYDFPEQKLINVDWQNEFGLELTDTLAAFKIVVEEPFPTLVTEEFDEPFMFSFVNEGSYAFQLGVKKGQEEGYVAARDEAYAEGFLEGNSVGYEEGYGVGKEYGYAKGEEQGYYKGRADEQEESGLFGLAYAVVDAPVSALSNLLGFEILGVNIGALFFSVISFFLMLAIVLFLRRMLF